MMLTLTTSSAEETTTNNLISQDFSTGWSGTATQRHDNSTVAAVDDTYIKSDDVSLKDDANLTEAQLQDGFTSNHSFKYWHWNNYNSTVTSTVTVTKADGEATTQIRTYNSTGCGYINCGSYQSGSDTLSISRSTQTDFDINVRYDFTDTSNSTSHYSVDLKEPSLTVTYESEPIDQSIQDEINDILEDLEEFFFEEETFTFNEEPQFEMEVEMEMETFAFSEEFIEEFFMEMDEEFFMEDDGMEFEDGPMITFADTEMMEEIYEESNEIIAAFLPMVSEEEEFSSEETFAESNGPFFMESTEETFEEEEIIEEESSTMTETFEEEVIEEESTEMAEETIEDEPTEMVAATNEEEKEEEIKEEKSTSETSKKSTIQAKKDSKQKKIQQKKAIRNNLVKVMDKIDRDIKDISKNLQIKNIIKLDAMISDQASLDIYNIPFYKSKDIYLDQIDIRDLRQLYANANLNTYIGTDPVFIKEEKLKEINIQKQRLLIELEQLRNG